MRHRLIPSLAVVTLAATTAACEGRTSGTLTTGPTSGARVRLVNALTSSPSVDLVVDGLVSFTGVVFGDASPYASLTLASHRMQARATTTGTTLVDFTRDLNTEGSFSFIPAPGLSQFGALFIADDLTPVSGQGKLRVVHVAAAPGAISVYLTSPTADLSSATAQIPLLPFGVASPYVTVAPGTYRVRVTAAGNPSTVLIDLGNLVVASGTVRTLLVTDAPGGGGLPPAISVVSDVN